MEKINITVNLKYTVSFSEEVSDELYEQLEEFLTLGSVDADLATHNDVDRAFEWLSNRCQEENALEYEIEIIDMEDE